MYLHKLFWCFIILLFGLKSGFGQKNKDLTYHSDIEPILKRSCIVCHYKNGPAPFSLETYEDFVKRDKFIAFVTSIRYMPPWKADPSFRSFRNEHILSDHEISLFMNWLKGKKLKGKPLKDVKKEVERPLTYKETPDLSLAMNAPYRIPNDNKDDFRFFHIPTYLKKDAYINGIEFVAGNKQRVHHSRIMLDTTGRISQIDGLSETDTAIYKFQRYPLADEFLYGWVPGNFKFRFPKGFGKKIYADANIILNMHYAPSVLDQTDQSKVNLYLIDQEDIEREVFTFILRETHISNQPFYIPADTKPTFYMSSGPIGRDISLLTIQPHAHLLGKSFRAFAITPDGDMIPLIKINKWDFNWQMTYEFNHLIHVPAGSVIIMEGQYDNTENNAANPFFPPQDVTYGWRTVDEMMNLIFYYVDYVKGDELLDLRY